MKTHLCTFCVLVVAACGGSAETSGNTVEEPAAAPAPAEPAPAPAASDLVARGGELYAANCAGCHGDAGQGGDKAPPVVGKAALPLDPRPGSKRGVQFKTALDVFKFVKANMPPGKGGSLTDDEYLAIMAFDLSANGVDLSGKTLDAATAESIVLH